MAFDGTFNWVYLLVLLICGFLSVLFLFYFNRIFASIVSYVIRTYVWRQYHVYIDIQALQFSLLGGRCFFKGFRYHGHNETILVNDGYITWRYWLRRVRIAGCLKATIPAGEPAEDEEDQSRGTGSVKAHGASRLPCRIKLKIRGVEWFIYNRTPAYEAIEKNLSGSAQSTSVEVESAEGPSNLARRVSRLVEKGTFQEFKEQEGFLEGDRKWTEKEAGDKSYSDSSESVVNKDTKQSTSKPESLPAFLSLLPVKVECGRAAIVMGNHSTRSVLIAKCDAVNAHIDARQAQSLDLYKQAFDFDFIHPIVEMKENHSFKDPEVTTVESGLAADVQAQLNAAKQHSSDQHGKSSAIPSVHLPRTSFKRMMRQVLSSLSSRPSKTKKQASTGTSQIPGQDHWLGLTRYLDDTENIVVEQERWKGIEYGRHPVIVDSPSISMSLHWDAPGLVRHHASGRTPQDYKDDINGEKPPEWAIELGVHGGSISYGPWADRLRNDLQPMFFPNSYKDAVPASRLTTGQPRVSTVFRLCVDIEQATTFMIPTREASKDWRWKDERSTRENTIREETASKERSKKKKAAKITTLPPGRPYGWLDVELEPNSSVTFIMDLVARRDGYRNLLNIDVKNPKMSSSVNHALLLRAQAANFSCDLSYPLRWNEIRQWNIAIKAEGLELFLLRDHIFLFTDLVNDWSVGPPAEFYTFVPFVYTIDLRLEGFNLYFNANDSNVINDPSSLEENTFLTIWGQRLNAAIQIPLVSLRPSRNEITFDIDAQDGGFKLLTPPWNTQHVFLPSSEIATMDDLKISGSYDYATSTSAALTDVLRMSVHGISPRIWLYGFLVRAFMRIKDNYFGDDIHFRTLEEYQEQVSRGDTSTSGGDASIKRATISNDLDVILSITAVTADVLMPAHIYSASTHVSLGISSLGLELRFTNYYMDLEINFSPITVSYESSSMTVEQSHPEKSEIQVFIDGVGVRGHRLFGLPPTEPTYVCNWDFTIGAVTGECSVSCMKTLSSALQCFSFTFDDAENAMPALSPIVIHDVTFLRVQIELIHVWLRHQNAAVLLSAQDLNLKFNDSAGSFFSEQFLLEVPSLAMGLADIGNVPPGLSSEGIQLKTHAYFETGVRVFTQRRKRSFSFDRQMQQQHIALHDNRTSRISWLIREDGRTTLQASNSQNRIAEPAMPYPPMPQPLQTADVRLLSQDSESLQSSTSVRSRSSLKQKASFLVNDFRKDRGDARTTYSYPTPDPVTSSSTPPEGGQNSLKRNHEYQQSPYIRPQFQLDGASLELRDVPQRATNGSLLSSPLQGSGQDISDQENKDLQAQQDKCERTSILVKLGQRTRGLVKPESLQILATFFEQAQIHEPSALLDKLQIDALDALPQAHQTLDSHDSITELRMDLSCLNLRFLHQTTSEEGLNTKELYCDVNVNHCVASVRQRKKRGREAEGKASNALSGHLMVDEIQLTSRASDCRIGQEHAQIGLRLVDMSAWGCWADESTAHVRLKDVRSELSVQQMDALAVLVPCVENWIKDVQQIEIISKQQDARVRLLVLATAVEGQDIPDPPFLTRASYVIRSACSHVRSSESWRIVSRLRYVYHVLPQRSQARLRIDGVTASTSCPNSAREDVVAIFERLGMWEGNDVRDSTLLNNVFGGKASGGTTNTKDISLKASIKARDICLTLQPGQGPSELHFENVAAEVVLLRRHMQLEGASTSDTTLASQLHCSDTSVSLNLNLLQPLHDLVAMLQDEGAQELGPAVPKLGKPEPRTFRMHVVLVSATNTLSLDGPNLRVLYLCHPLSSSVIFSQALEDRSPGTVFLTYADVATMEILSDSQIVSVGKVDRPSIYGNLDSQKPNAPTGNWHLAVSCTDIFIKILEDPPTLLELADRIASNEVAAVNRILSSGQHASKVRTNPNTSTSTSLGQPHVALFLDSYMIGYKILPALSYRFVGRAGRLSIKPGPSGPSGSILDFDLKEHAHAFLGRAGNDVEAISELVLPPVNGRLAFSMASSRKDISFQGTVEQISLDAAAVHALLATLNRREIGELVSNTRQNLTVVLQRHKPTVSSEKVGSAAQSVVLFDANVTLVGLSIHTKSSKDANLKDISKLQFDLGHIHAKGNNRDPGGQVAIKYPEIFVNLQGLEAALARTRGGQSYPCGRFRFGATLQATSKLNERQERIRAYQSCSTLCETIIHTETASVIIDILTDLRESFRDIDMTNEVKGLQKLRRITIADVEKDLPSEQSNVDKKESTALFDAMYSLKMTGMRAIWKVGDAVPMSPGREAEDLVLSFGKIDFTTRKDNAARLLIQDLQLQMVPPLQKPTDRSLNSALLPEVVFNVAYMSTPSARRLAFQAAGKALNLRLTSLFIIPASNLRRSIALAVDRIRGSIKTKAMERTKTGGQTETWFKHKRLTSLLIDADFAGAVVEIQGRNVSDTQSLAVDILHGRRLPQQGRYGQFTHDDTSSKTKLRAPGVALKVEYKDAGAPNTSLNAEVKVDPSSNVLYPSVVPLVLEISSSVKEVVGEPDHQAQEKEKEKATEQRSSSTALMGDDPFGAADPNAIFQNCTVNLGLRICKQDFSMSCQPMARVAATAYIDNIYITANTVQSSDHGRSFALSASFSSLRASVQHVYSRESSGSFEMEAAIVSLMNSKHLGAPTGISVISQISPVKVNVNVKQSQDFLLFRDIWLPADIRKSASVSTPSPSVEPQTFIVQRYQQIASTGAFPWNATLSVSRLEFQIDLGQSLGKSGLAVTSLWVSSTKSSNWEQNLCLGLGRVRADASGRMSGFVDVQGIKVRTSIRWPTADPSKVQAPLVQATAAFESLQIKAAFEYQPFLIVSMSGFEFLMYNVRNRQSSHSDRLVCVVDLKTLHAFSTATSASQGVALYQAFERLIQEKHASYQTSLRDLDKFLKKRSTVHPQALTPASPQAASSEEPTANESIRLQTKVMVSIGIVNVGVFPSTFVDSQLLRIQALDAAAQFGVSLERERLRSILELALGQLEVTLPSVPKPEARKSIGDVSLDAVIMAASNSRGGPIIKVPKVVATMQTWQSPGATEIEYIFRSSFQGKVDVGLNYSRIDFLRGMWNTHVRALASRLGKPLPQSALQITAALEDNEQRGPEGGKGGREKITAVVNVPQSKYQYKALQPPIIETPQLRDMGEATPPLEWIGLHRDRLPNLTHQIVIVSLLELAKEVDDAYSKILGSS
ncbi:MAG: hypothetical protein Q9174_001369 [Haloplaca sp. 1 TL-2023]